MKTASPMKFKELFLMLIIIKFLKTKSTNQLPENVKINNLSVFEYMINFSRFKMKSFSAIWANKCRIHFIDGFS